MKECYRDIIEELGEAKVLIDEPLFKHSHIGIGGPADLFYIAHTRDQLIKAARVALANNIEYIILGWGSNSLFSDKGIRGLVIKNEYKEFEVIKSSFTKIKKPSKNKNADSRQVQWNLKETNLYSFDDLYYDESACKEISVKVSSGYDLPDFIVQMIQNGITGLQWFAGIPGTIAGAVYNNIHGGKILIDEYVEKATVLKARTCDIEEVDSKYFMFEYDKTSMHRNKDVLIDVTFRLYKGDVEKAEYVRREWIKRKSIQPQRSLGSTFANPPVEIAEKAGYPTPSIGYFVEQILGWRDKEYEGGVSMGRANGHAGIITNEGNGTAKDYVTLMRRVQKEYYLKTGYRLKPEIFLFGNFE